MNTPSAGHDARDWSKTLFLPSAAFPMRGPKPGVEDSLLARWDTTRLAARMAAAAAGRPSYVLHDGPPYANGHLHMGHALNKVLKDVVLRSRRMEGLDARYVPGWDCHGLPVEWKVEEEFRAAGRPKDTVPAAEFRAACRAYAARWVETQAAEFRALGVSADFGARYETMDFAAEAAVASEFMSLAAAGKVRRGSKPVLWSVAEGTALAEAEVVHLDHVSDAVWVAFPVRATTPEWEGVSVLAWTTTPWTLPANRALAFSSRASHSVYEVTEAPEGNRALPGMRFLLSDALARTAMEAARVTGFAAVRAVSAVELLGLACSHPLANLGYDFPVPMLDGPHVTDDAGTGFVHTAPGHGREDFDVWEANGGRLAASGVDVAVPDTVDARGTLTAACPGFEGRTVFSADGGRGDANDAVLGALSAAGTLVARRRMKHQYPHSWRSRKPLLYRTTPQWFVPMDAEDTDGRTLRGDALASLGSVAFHPETGRNRLSSMVASRPDWLLSRQRAWGVPLTMFRHRATGDLAPGPTFAGSAELAERVRAAFAAEGADAWFSDGADGRFLGGLVDDVTDWERVTDVLDVWFDSGCTHAFVLGGRVADLCLEGSDQHRGWFQSSLLEACATRGRAPYRKVATHGFVLDGKGQKMSKALGNVVSPADVVGRHSVDLLRLWVVSSDWTGDLRLGEDALKTASEAHRKVRNTLRWLLGNLAHHDGFECAPTEMPELERLLLHRMAEVDREVRAGYAELDFRRSWSALLHFVTADLSSFHFDVRKDVLYCDPRSSHRRRAALHALDLCLGMLCRWLAPMLPFTAEEAWLERHPSEEGSVHLERFVGVPNGWHDDALSERWATALVLRGRVLSALEVERAAGRLGGSLEACVRVHAAPDALEAVRGVDLAELCLVSEVGFATCPAGSERVEVLPARGARCARSRRATPDVGSVPGHPDLSARDAAAVMEAG